MDRCAAAVYFAVCKAEVKYRGYSVLEGVADTWDVPSAFFKKLRALQIFTRETL